MSQRKDALTNRNYWEAYYKGHQPIQSDLSVKIYKQIEGYLPVFSQLHLSAGAKILELGGFPGRNGAYLANRFQASLTAIDFNRDEETFFSYCRALGIQNPQYICSDLFTLSPESQYDLVFSVGLIEHFLDFEKVMDLHAHWAKPQGKILIILPNHRFFSYCYRSIFDADNLKHHNRHAMKLKEFGRFAERNNLIVLNQGYFGPFLTNPHQKLNLIKRFFHYPIKKIARLLRRVIQRYPSRLYSSSLYAIFEKN